MKTSAFNASLAAFVAAPATTLLVVAQLISCGGDDATSSIGPDASEASATDSTTTEDGSSTPEASSGEASSEVDADASGMTVTDAEAGAVSSSVDASDAGDGASCAVSVPTEGTFLTTLATTTCQTLKACCGTGSSFDMASCVSLYGNPLYGGFLGVGFAAQYIDGGHITYNPSASCECLGSAAAINCGLIPQTTLASIQQTCFAALPGTVPVASGDAGDAGRCASSYECAPGAYCTVDPSGQSDASLGSCMALVADGGACTNDKECSYLGNGSPPLYCSTTTHACVPRVAAGTACQSNSECSSNTCIVGADGGAPTCASGEIFSSASTCTYFTLPDAGDGG
jgi:hypothetical protein